MSLYNLLVITLPQLLRALTVVIPVIMKLIACSGFRLKHPENLPRPMTPQELKLEAEFETQSQQALAELLVELMTERAIRRRHGERSRELNGRMGRLTRLRDSLSALNQLRKHLSVQHKQNVTLHLPTEKETANPAPSLVGTAKSKERNNGL